MKEIIAEYKAQTSTNSSEADTAEKGQELSKPASAESAMQVYIFLLPLFCLLSNGSLHILLYIFQLDRELQNHIVTPQMEDGPETGMDITNQMWSSSSVDVFLGIQLIDSFWALQAL